MSLEQGYCKKLGEELIDRGLVTEMQLERALSDQKRLNCKLGHILVNQGILVERKLVEILSENRDIPTVSLRNYRIPTQLKQIFPKRIAEKFHVVPLEIKQGFSVTLATDDPENIIRIKEIQQASRLYIEPVLAGYWDIQACLIKNYHSNWRDYGWNFSNQGRTSDIAKAFDLFELEESKNKQVQKNHPDDDDQEITLELENPVHFYLNNSGSN